MSIPVSCDQCFQTFNVQDEYAGRTLRCKSCGAAMTVTRESESMDFGSANTSRRKRPRKKRRSAAPKITVIVIGCLLGVGLLGSGIWFGVTKINARSKRKTSNKSKKSEIDSKNAVASKSAEDDGPFPISKENWLPDPKLLQELRAEENFGGYSIRLPKAGQLRRERNSQKEHTILWMRNGRYVGAFKMHIDHGWDRERLAGEMRAASNLKMSIQFLRGNLNGHFCYRTTWEKQLSNGEIAYNCIYNVLIGTDWVAVGGFTLSPRNSHNYRLLDAAVRTLRKR
ncbi:MAG: hypothetical protein IID45_10980 [Planctomycetes bacterium]|nr:hypothetical protein [Planctomycetota bacterium]